MSITVEAAIGEGREALRTVVVDARREAEILLGNASNRPRGNLIAWPRRQLTNDETHRYRALLRRRAGGEPTAYILAHREFWSLDLHVTRDTLIPRHETELLVELALQRIPVNDQSLLLDLGTGSGAVALAIASERPMASIVATDASPAALDVARGNAATLGLGTVEFALGDWLDAIPEGIRFDAILSNPPYVAASDPHLNRGDLPWEPRSALVGGADGLDAIRRITRDAPGRLEPGGWLMLEHGPDQGGAIRDLLVAAGMSKVSCHRDLLGLERVTIARSAQTAGRISSGIALNQSKPVSP